MQVEEKLAIEGGEPVRKVPLPYDPRFGLPVIEDDEIQAVVNVLKSKRLTMMGGTQIQQFEKKFAEYNGAKHAIAVANGTAALTIALQALGVGPGDEVIVPAHTFVATPMSVLHARAVPVFADLEKDTYNMDPVDVERKVTERTKAILPVHWHGNPVDMDALNAIARAHNLVVLEDAAQAAGAEYKGVKVGVLGDAGIFSFFQTKNMTTGEGGMIVTNDDKVAELARSLRRFGERIDKYGTYYVRVGYNFRMSEIEGALGQVQLTKLDSMNALRIRNAQYLTENLNKIEGVETPKVKGFAKNVYYMYHTRILPSFGMPASKVLEALNAEGVTPWPGPNMPLYMHPVFRNKVGYPAGTKVEYKMGDCPVAEGLCNTMVNPPMSPLMSLSDCEDIVRAFRKVAYRAKHPVAA